MALLDCKKACLRRFPAPSRVRDDVLILTSKRLRQAAEAVCRDRFAGWLRDRTNHQPVHAAGPRVRQVQHSEVLCGELANLQQVQPYCWDINECFSLLLTERLGVWVGILEQFLG